MKQTLMILALLAAGVASAATLQYGLEFNNSNSLVNVGVGTTTIDRTSGYINYSATTPLGADGDVSHSPHGATFNIAADSGIAGLDFTDGFSIGVHVNYTATPYWKDALTFKISDVTFKMELTNGNDWVLYGGPDLGIVAGTEVVSDITLNKWYHLGFTFQGNTLTLYVTGVKSKEITMTLPEGKETFVFQQIKGAGSQAPGNGRILIDNLAIYDGVLTADDFAYLVSNSMPQTFTAAAPVPEPATATLSLLALAGLAARRRRK